MNYEIVPLNTVASQLIVVGATCKKAHIHGGTQHIIQFPNGYGASVINHSFSRGVELAVLKFDSEGDFDLTYDTPVTDDVIGHLDEETLLETLIQISELAPH